MLLWISLVCLLSANLVISQVPLPEVFAGYDPRTLLRPLKNGLVSKRSSEHPRVIRALLAVRQTECPATSTGCTDEPNRCCPTGGDCCYPAGCCEEGYYCYSPGCCQTGYTGCGGNSCCGPDETCCPGGGCCGEGHFCSVANGVHGCCADGSNCTPDTPPPPCTDPNYALCPEENFCCPAEYECYRDPSGAPACRSPSDSGVTSPPASTATQPSPTTTEISPTPTLITTGNVISSTPTLIATTHRPSTILPTTASIPTLRPSADGSSNGTGNASSALSVTINTLLTLFAGVGVFTFIF